MSYFVTGATGFIGRFLVPELLKRDGDIHVLVRSGSEDKLAARAEQWGAGDRIKPVTGDLGKPMLGIDPQWIEDNHGIDHMFHLAAIYDLTASEERNETLNNGGTRQAVAVANALGVGVLHHTSSVAAAGLYEGTFTEDMFDEGQTLPSPYHRTKFESEKIVRDEAQVPWRVYRPAIVVGHSRTGEMDKIDGPYYFFTLLRLAGKAPTGLPLFVPGLGDTNVVPVDFVAQAMDHIAHVPGLDGKAFHLTSVEPLNSVELMNAFGKYAHAPRLTEVLPKQVMHWTMRIPGVATQVLPRLGIPAEAIEHTEFTCRFDSTNTVAALVGTGIEVPPIGDYAGVLWKYWERNLAD
ncbi:SDR family oxidoreductase [Antrihabitans cavernicola]|uniref:NAD-dependent epimerase/dehydratase family protein n=1 Tax=Antrihabitans cavernicola TaxID=2495913 RepID=A0A5A7S6S2_9NOCA|nr:SDR family oxidoreductase [Spelaeibacter cavernicola]KAA0021576.1 NAD-dependent epimerase/dehydratase family protein [Spelaeibacter cavernicola]